jgi:hypothetical protein
LPFHIRAAALAALFATGACSPTFNWREWRLAGAPLLALMPCKPETATRTVPLAGRPVELHMHSCDTGGLRFAVAWADLGQAESVPLALASWRAASLQSLRAAPAPADTDAGRWPVSVAGAPDAVGVHAQGVDALGREVQSRAAYFAQGSVVYQAAVYGAELPAEPLETFFSGLRLSGP